MNDTTTPTLPEALSAWITHYGSHPHLWQTPVGRTIRNWLLKRGNFKNAPRGNPRKGYLAQQRARD